MIFYEVWPKCFPEDSERAFVSLERKDCEEWIELHSLDCSEGYIISETETSKIPPGEFAYIRGYTYNETYEAEQDGYVLAGIEDQMSKYRQFGADFTYLDPSEFEKLFGKLDFDNAENNIVFLKTKFPGEYDFFLRVPREKIRGKEYHDLKTEVLEIAEWEYEQQIANKATEET